MKSKNEGLNPAALRRVLRKAKRTMLCQNAGTVSICSGPILVQVSPEFYRDELAALYPVTLAEGVGFDTKNGQIAPDTLQRVADSTLHLTLDPAHDTGERVQSENAGPLALWASDTGRFALLPADQLKIMTGKGWTASIHGPLTPVCFYNMEQGTALHVCPVRIHDDYFKSLYKRFGGCNND